MLKDGWAKIHSQFDGNTRKQKWKCQSSEFRDFWKVIKSTALTQWPPQPLQPLRLNPGRVMLRFTVRPLSVSIDPVANLLSRLERWPAFKNQSSNLPQVKSMKNQSNCRKIQNLLGQKCDRPRNVRPVGLRTQEAKFWSRRLNPDDKNSWFWESESKLFKTNPKQRWVFSYV